VALQVRPADTWGDDEAGRCTLTPPDPQLKGAWYPGGFKPLPLNINPGFKTRLSNATCAATTRAGTRRR
jgi:hypothetical protein